MAENAKNNSNKRQKNKKPWRELSSLCKKMAFWLYTSHESDIAHSHCNQLRNILQEIPKNDMSVLREEGYAILCELEGDLNAAIQHRRREIELMEALYQDIANNNYDDMVKEYMLADRDADAFNLRHMILRTLEKKVETELKRGI